MVKFVVGNINPGTVRHEYMLRILDLFQHSTSDQHDTSCIGYIPKSPAGPYLDCERNLVVQEFMDGDDYSSADVIVFIDSDTVPDSTDMIHALVARCTDQAPVVGGMYLNQFAGFAAPRALAFDWLPSTPTDPQYPMPVLTPIDPADLDGPREVAVLGTGFLAIHRTLLDHMRLVFDSPSPWFAELPLFGQQMGEDVTFCMRVQSEILKRSEGSDREHGYPVIIHPDLTAAHYKTTAIRISTQES